MKPRQPRNPGQIRQADILGEVRVEIVAYPGDLRVSSFPPEGRDLPSAR